MTLTGFIDFLQTHSLIAIGAALVAVAVAWVYADWLE